MEQKDKRIAAIRKSLRRLRHNLNIAEDAKIAAGHAIEACITQAHCVDTALSEANKQGAYQALDACEAAYDRFSRERERSEEANNAAIELKDAIADLLDAIERDCVSRDKVLKDQAETAHEHYFRVDDKVTDAYPNGRDESEALP